MGNDQSNYSSPVLVHGKQLREEKKRPVHLRISIVFVCKRTNNSHTNKPWLVCQNQSTGSLNL